MKSRALERPETIQSKKIIKMVIVDDYRVYGIISGWCDLVIKKTGLKPADKVIH